MAEAVRKPAESPAETVPCVRIAERDVAVNRRRGGDIRVLLSPKTVGSTSGFMGTLTLAPGRYVAEHYHPYSEEFLYVVRGRLTGRVDGDRIIELSPGDGVMIPMGMRHRVWNPGTEETFAVFQLSPLAPRPDLGHVDTEPLPPAGDADPVPEVGGPS
ncbi:cupin domain-containing protein [Actinomadura sp. 9N407]|uniref:cupin domain-containing protein n=1 Tax=Actinomadura sp. 9N407 TaxID=3375154 RepID=UPI0037B04D6F